MSETETARETVYILQSRKSGATAWGQWAFWPRLAGLRAERDLYFQRHPDAETRILRRETTETVVSDDESE